MEWTVFYWFHLKRHQNWLSFQYRFCFQTCVLDLIVEELSSSLKVPLTVWYFVLPKLVAVSSDIANFSSTNFSISGLLLLKSGMSLLVGRLNAQVQSASVYAERKMQVFLQNCFAANEEVQQVYI